MRSRLSVHKKEAVFCTELVKLGIPFDRAVTVARILSRGQLEESLTSAERQLIQKACAEWLKQRQRQKCINQQIKPHLTEIKATLK